MEYYVFVTNNCNSDCSYCCGIEISKSTSTSDTPEYSIDQLCTFIDRTQKKFGDSNVDIIFFGGEPTLNFDYISEVIESTKIRIASYNIRYILHTNGLLLDKAPDNVITNAAVVILSVNYEKIPRSKLFPSYFSKIIDNIQYFRSKSSAKFMCRLTITENVSLYTNALQVSSFFDYVHWQLQHCEAFIDFESYYSTYKYEVTLLYKYWYSFLEKGTILSFSPFVSALKLISQNVDKNYLCGFNRSCVYIQTNGNCYACPESMNDGRFYLGNVHDGVSFLHYSLADSSCSECIYIDNCYGKCARIHIVYDSDHVNEYCKLNSVMFNLFMKDKDKLTELLRKYPLFISELNDVNLQLTDYVP